MSQDIPNISGKPKGYDDIPLPSQNTKISGKRIGPVSHLSSKIAAKVTQLFSSVIKVNIQEGGKTTEYYFKISKESKRAYQKELNSQKELRQVIEGIKSNIEKKQKEFDEAIKAIENYEEAYEKFENPANESQELANQLSENLKACYEALKNNTLLKNRIPDFVKDLNSNDAFDRLKGIQDSLSKEKEELLTRKSGLLIHINPIKSAL